MSASNLWKLGLISFSLLSSSLAYSLPSDFIDTATWGMYQGNAGHTGYVPININIVNMKQRWHDLALN